MATDRAYGRFADVAQFAQVPFRLLDQAPGNGLASLEQQLRLDDVVARIDVQLVREPVKRRDLAVGPGVEDRQFTEMDGADAKALRLEFRKCGTVAGRLGASGLRGDGYRSGQDGQAGREPDCRARRTDEIEVTRRVGRPARRESTAARPQGSGEPDGGHGPDERLA
jgi:hypothetical protein